MNNYLASIIVCTYDRAELLPRVLGQLSTQNYPKNQFEILVVDNGSTDDTPDVVHQLIPKLNITLRYVREERPGISFARNRGAQEACHPYLVYLDDDCTVGTDWLPWLLSGFDLHEHVSVVAGRVTVNYDDQKIPGWLGSKTERWLAEYNFAGSQPRLMENPGYVCEGNMAIKRQAWESAGGFLGMDQFGIPHMAAQEIIHLLEQIRRQGGRVAFVPSAIASHHTLIPPWQQLIMRAYWHGVSDGILSYLLNRHSSLDGILYIMRDGAAMIVFLVLSLLSQLLLDRSTSLYQLLRATARLGKIGSELRLAGNWDYVQRWVSMHGRSFHRSEKGGLLV